MKNSKDQKKLSLTKLTITKLTNPNKIYGGVTNNDPGEGTDKNMITNTEQPKKPKCVNGSKDFVEE